MRRKKEEKSRPLMEGTGKIKQILKQNVDKFTFIKQFNNQPHVLMGQANPLRQVCFCFCSVGSSHLSFSNEVGHNGSVTKLGSQMDAAAALAIDQRWVCTIFHELHHHR